MGFSAKQLQALRRPLDGQAIRTRESHGRELSYIEGWYAFRKPIGSLDSMPGAERRSKPAAYSPVKIAAPSSPSTLPKCGSALQAAGSTIIREGHGSGEGRGTSPGEVHDIALKAAETDATKRALATFGKPFGLELYRKDKITSSISSTAVASVAASPPTQPRVGFHPDDTTPIPRPSHYYGRRHQNSMTAASPSGSRPANPTCFVRAPLGAGSTRPPRWQNRQEPTHHRRTKAPARQSPSEICGLTTLSGLRAATVRPSSSAICATQSHRS